MSVVSLLLVLLAAVLHAVWNVLAKGVRGDGTLFVWWYGLLSAVVLVPLSFFDPNSSPTAWGWPLIFASIVSGLLHTAYGVFLQTGYERAPLSVVYPVARGTGPMLTMIVAIAFMGEHLSTLAVMGAVVVLVGVAIVATLGRPKPSLTDTDIDAPGPLSGVIWGALVGACIAGYTLWDDHSMTALSLPPVRYFALTSVFLALSLTPTALKRRTQVMPSWRQDRSRIIAVGILSPMAYILVLFAMRSAPVALVAPLRECSIVVGSVLAWWLYRESRLLPRLVGACVVLAGIAMISSV